MIVRGFIEDNETLSSSLEFKMQTELIQQISDKKRELNNLEVQYDREVEEEKFKILKSKSKGISKSLYLFGFEFESSSSRTPQYLEFHKVFKREFAQLLKPHIKKIEFSKPNHFDVSGFFELNESFENRDTNIYYFSIGDLRWDKILLIRTAKGFKDYTGGSNNYITLEEGFEERLIKFIQTDKGWI